MRRAGHEPGGLGHCRILLEPLVGHLKNLSLGLNVMGTPWKVKQRRKTASKIGVTVVGDKSRSKRTQRDDCGDPSRK